MITFNLDGYVVSTESPLGYSHYMMHKEFHGNCINTKNKHTPHGLSNDLQI